MEKNSKIFVAGHRGMVGSAIVRRLTSAGYHNIVTRRSSEVDLRDQASVRNLFDKEKPEYVFLAAAKVGGILANKNFKADFIYDNLMIQENVIHASYENNVRKLLFLGSSCIYPRMAPQPIKEDYLLSGPLEPTNDAYAIAKIAGIYTCQAYWAQHGCRFISLMPTNLYGPNDNYDLETAHVLPALLMKFYHAVLDGKDKVTVWGTGTPRREFLHVDDLADACLFLMLNYEKPDPVNVGTGTDLSIHELANLIAKVVGFKGHVVFDATKPDGTPRKLLDGSQLAAMGWRHQISLEQGIRSVFNSEIKEKALSASRSTLR